MTAAKTPSAVTIAHLSDVHLGPLPRIPLGLLNAKRAAGIFNWLRKRQHIHRPEVAAALVRDLVAMSPDHIIVSGDLINIGLPEEIQRAAQWLKTLGTPETVSVVPGNHDIYAPVRGRRLGHKALAPWSKHFEPCSEGTIWRGRDQFPFVRVVARADVRVAVIGCNSAIETPPLIAHGKLGDDQRAALARVLKDTFLAGLVRVVVLHHPPMPGLTSPHHHLLDAPELVEVFRAHGAELVLHGHNHRRMINSIEGPQGPIPVVGVPSASAAKMHKGEPLARAHVYEISQVNRLRIDMVARGLETLDGPIREIERVTLLDRAG